MPSRRASVAVMRAAVMGCASRSARPPPPAWRRGRRRPSGGWGPRPSVDVVGGAVVDEGVEPGAARDAAAAELLGADAALGHPAAHGGGVDAELVADLDGVEQFVGGGGHRRSLLVM